MSKKIEIIISAIKDQVKPAMDVWEDDFFNFIRDLQEYCTKTVYTEYEEQKEDIENRMNPRLSAHDKKMTAISYLKEKKGWKKSYERFFHRSIDDLKNVIHKEAEKKLKKIDVAVNKKLKDIDITKIQLLNFTPYSPDGYCEGAWRINDEKTFSFRGIYAGGYNVQCFHVRTLYTFK